MKKLTITIIFLFIIIYPPHLSNAENKESIENKVALQESIINYLSVKNEVLKYQITKKIDSFYDLFHSIKTAK